MEKIKESREFDICPNVNTMKQKTTTSKSVIIKNSPLARTSNKLSVNAMSDKERKLLIDSLVDPVFVISNANSLLKEKLEKFVDSETRNNFYMIDRAQKKLIDSINQLRYSTNPK